MMDGVALVKWFEWVFNRAIMAAVSKSSENATLCSASIHFYAQDTINHQYILNGQ